MESWDIDTYDSLSSGHLPKLIELQQRRSSVLFTAKVWNRWGPIAWFKWALGRPLPGDDGDKYYPEGYHTHDLGPKYFEGKGYKELEGFKETLRQQRMGLCPFP